MVPRRRSLADLASERPAAQAAPIAPAAKSAREVVRTTVYIPAQVYDVLRAIAFDERRRVHDLLLDGLDAVLKKHGKPIIERKKAGRQKVT